MKRHQFARQNDDGFRRAEPRGGDGSGKTFAQFCREQPFFPIHDECGFEIDFRATGGTDGGNQPFAVPFDEQCVGHG